MSQEPFPNPAGDVCLECYTCRENSQIPTPQEPVLTSTDSPFMVTQVYNQHFVRQEALEDIAEE